MFCLIFCSSSSAPYIWLGSVGVSTSMHPTKVSTKSIKDPLPGIIGHLDYCPKSLSFKKNFWFKLPDSSVKWMLLPNSYILLFLSDMMRLLGSCFWKQFLKTYNTLFCYFLNLFSEFPQRKNIGSQTHFPIFLIFIFLVFENKK